MTAEFSWSDCPWPGPRPYQEEDALRFFGRNEEIIDLLDLVRKYRLAVLAAVSGAGKTSLLQAGLVPRLRYQRHCEGGWRDGTGVVLLLRDWGASTQLGPSELFVEALRRDVARVGRLLSSESGIAYDNALEGGLSRDHQAVAVALAAMDASAAPPRKPDEVVAYVRELGRQPGVGGLIVVLDQFEEFLGSGQEEVGEDLAQESLDIVSGLFKLDVSVQTLLSLRAEYLFRLRPLDRVVEGGTGDRTYYLNRMNAPTARSFLDDSLRESPDVGISDDETKSRLLACVSARGEAADPSSSVDLLKLQAILLMAYDAAQESQGIRVIDGAVLKALEDEVAASGGTLATTALQAFVDSVFGQRKEALLGDHPEVRDALERIRMPLVRRIAARLDVALSSPTGYKKHVEDEDLFEAACGEDLEPLLVDPNIPLGGVAAQLLASLRGRAQLQDLAPLFNHDDDEVRKLAVSGRAWEDGLSALETAERLAEASQLTLDLMTAADILKGGILRTGTGPEDHVHTYELVHDGFGPALRSWAQSIRRSPDFVLPSLVASRGESFAWPELTDKDVLRVYEDGGEIKGACWLGCVFRGTKISRVSFANCNLMGGFLNDCRIEDVTFQNCNLDGLVVRGGTWRNVTFNDCTMRSHLYIKQDPEGLFWDNIHIENCDLSQVTALALTLGHSGATVRNSALRLAQFVGLAGGGRIVADHCDFYNATFERACDKTHFTFGEACDYCERDTEPPVQLYARDAGVKYQLPPVGPLPQTPSKVRLAPLSRPAQPGGTGSAHPQ
jgi:hypothetical protein